MLQERKQGSEQGWEIAAGMGAWGHKEWALEGGDMTPLGFLKFPEQSQLCI